MANETAFTENNEKDKYFSDWPRDHEENGDLICYS